jgi:hypothetical protein
MRALWPGTEKTEREEGKATCHRDREGGRSPSLPSGLALLSSIKAGRRIREAASQGGIAPGDDGAAMRSVLNERELSRGRTFRVRSGGVRWRYRGHIPLQGTAHGADNIIGPSGQDVAPTGCAGISGAAFGQPKRRPSAVKV